MTNKPEFLGKACKLLTSKTVNDTFQPNGLKLHCAERFVIWPEEIPTNGNLFKFAKIEISPGEDVVKEEFHVYQASLHSEKLKLTVFNVTNDDVNNKNIISSIDVEANTNGWRIFDVTGMMSTDQDSYEQNYILTVIATSVATNNVVKVDFVRIIANAVEPPKMPIYVHFLNDERSHSKGNVCRHSTDVYNMQDGDEKACDALGL
ncbi:hypothetical protein HCN44_003547 [Aphidius gifuensis]|uniref:TGF-beta propeptide domain-containing protein n=1 Tax=Aphidius gifuensis TaxID=684658 RepID=A0A834XLU8_APHGI|nr:uncharacterized protein LOC122859691 [Aphidius gifuensis]KAF7987684.1 hypothetical protein HCN44_003547 [Aphidius gifuensis]